MKKVLFELAKAIAVGGGFILLGLIVFKAQPTPIQQPAPQAVCK